MKYLVKEWCLSEGFCLSREVIDTVYELLITGKANKKVPAGGHVIYVDRGRLFLTHDQTSSLPPTQALVEGEFTYGHWQVTVKPVSVPTNNIISGWQHVWAGSVEAIIPSGSHHLGPARMNASFRGGTTTISKWWNNHKVPAFLRHQVPVIWNGNTVLHEFLSPKGTMGTGKKDFIVTLSLSH